MNIVLLGATGFVGSAIVRAAEKQDVKLYAMRRHRNHVSHQCPTISWHLGTLAKCPDNLFPRDSFVLMHFANKQIDRDGSGFGDNVDGTQKLLARLPAHCLGIIYGSSMSVYGAGKQENITEDVKCQPQSPLAKSRYRVEQLVFQYAKDHHQWAISCRPRFIIGRGDNFLLPGLSKMFKKGLSVGNGQQVFSIIDVDDYAQILLQLASYIAGPVPSRQIAVNVSYRQPVSLNSIERIMSATERKIWRLPVSAWILKSLNGRHPRLSPMIDKLALIGLSHSGNVERLRNLIGGSSSILDQNPLIKIQSAVVRTVN